MRTCVFDETRRYVAGIDLAGAADHYVCGPRKDDGSHDIERFGTTTGELRRMLQWLRDRHVESVAMESTSVYWIPVHDILESGGLEVRLVDTREVKMVPGRKSDVKDCQWLQRLHSCGLLRGAFRPPEAFNAIRTVLREKRNVTEMRTQAIQAMQKSLDQMNIRLHHAVSDITGKTGMAILGAIVEGERDPLRLASLRDKRCRKSAAEIAEELTGTWREEHLFNLARSYETLVFLDGQLAAYEERVRWMFARLAAESGRPAPRPRPDNPAWSRERLRKAHSDIAAKADLERIMGFDPTTIDGVDYGVAALVAAELGNDFSAFPTENHFVSYIGLAPPLGKSAGKNVRTRRRVKNTHVVGLTLRQAATSLSRSQSELGGRFRSVKSRTDATTAVIATARRMAQYIYRGVKYGADYVDEGELAYEQRRRERTLRSMRRTIAKLGISASELGMGSMAG